MFACDCRCGMGLSTSVFKKYKWRFFPWKMMNLGRPGSLSRCRRTVTLTQPVQPALSPTQRQSSTKQPAARIPNGICTLSCTRLASGLPRAILPVSFHFCRKHNSDLRHNRKHDDSHGKMKNEWRYSIEQCRIHDRNSALSCRAVQQSPLPGNGKIHHFKFEIHHFEYKIHPFKFKFHVMKIGHSSIGKLWIGSQ